MAGAVLWTCPSSFCVAGAALYTCRVTCFVLRVFLRIALSGLRQVATMCKFRGMRGILKDVMKIDGRLTGNTDFGVPNFQVLSKTRRKTSILRLQSVKIGGSLARNARFDVPTCLVSSLWFSCGFAVSMGEAAKPLLSFSKVSKQVVMSFCKARAALCDISTCLIMCRKLLCVARRILLRRLHKMSCSCRGAFWRSLSSFCVAGQHCRRFGLRALHSTLYAPHSTVHPLHTTQHTLHSTIYTPHSIL